MATGGNNEARHRVVFSTSAFLSPVDPVCPRPDRPERCGNESRNTTSRSSPRDNQPTRPLTTDYRRNDARGEDAQREKSVTDTTRRATHFPFPLRPPTFHTKHSACLSQSEGDIFLSRLPHFFQFSHLLNDRSIDTRALLSRQQSSVTTVWHHRHGFRHSPCDDHRQTQPIERTEPSTDRKPTRNPPPHPSRTGRGNIGLAALSTFVAIQCGHF